jgi:hypothetical protein
VSRGAGWCASRCPREPPKIYKHGQFATTKAKHATFHPKQAEQEARREIGEEDEDEVVGAHLPDGVVVARYAPGQRGPIQWYIAGETGAYLCRE